MKRLIWFNHLICSLPLDRFPSTFLLTISRSKLESSWHITWPKHCMIRLWQMIESLKWILNSLKVEALVLAVHGIRQHQIRTARYFNRLCLRNRTEIHLAFLVCSTVGPSPSTADHCLTSCFICRFISASQLPKLETRDPRSSNSFTISVCGGTFCSWRARCHYFSFFLSLSPVPGRFFIGKHLECGNIVG